MNSFITENWVKSSANAYVGSVTQKAVSLLAENDTSDIEAYKSVLTDLITRVGMSSVIPFLGASIPAKTSQGKIPVMYTKYAGKNDATITTDIVKVLAVPDVTGFTVDGDISSSGTGVGTILYIEPNKILVKVTSGTFVKGESIDAAATYATAVTTVTNVYSDLVGVGKVLSGYSGPYTTAEGEALTKADAKEIQFKVAMKEYNAKERAVMTGVTIEFIQDMKAMFGFEGTKQIVGMISTSMNEEIQQEYFKYLKSIAVQKPDLTLSLSYGTQSALGQGGVFEDILAVIMKMVGEISTKTNIADNYYVIGSSNVVAAIKHIAKVYYREEYQAVNNAYEGHLLNDNIALYSDNFSYSDYFVVGCAGPKGTNNSGVIFVPYMTDFVEMTDPETMENMIAVKTRYDIVRSPLDSDTGTNSDFFQMAAVSFANLTNYPQ